MIEYSRWPSELRTNSPDCAYETINLLGIKDRCNIPPGAAYHFLEPNDLVASADLKMAV